MATTGAPGRYLGRVHRVGLVMAVVAVLLLPACNRGDDPTIGAGSGSSLGTTQTAPPDTNAPGATPPISAAPVEPRAHLTDARLGARSGGDRVVFEFDTVVPGYVVEYVSRPVTEDGSGNEVAVKGEAILQVRMENASAARFEGENVVITYKGPRRIVEKGTGVVTEVVQVGDFEGQLTWVIGLTKMVPTVAISALGGPSRLVLDLAAP